MVRIDTTILLAFGIAFLLGMCLAALGAWLLWRRIKRRREQKSIDR